MTEPPISSTNDDPSTPGGNGSGSSAAGDEVRAEHPDQVRHRDHRPVEVVHRRALVVLELGRAHERLADVGGVLHLDAAAERDVVPDAGGGGDHRRRRGGGQPLVASRAVDGVWADADRRHAVVLEVADARALVGALEHPVERARVLLVAERGDRGRVDERRDPAAAAAHGLEHVDGAEHVDARAQRRVGAHERDLERGEVDHVGDPVLVERALDHVEVGDVGAHAHDALDLLRGERDRHPRRLLGEVEGDDLVPAVQQRADRPHPDRAEGAGDEITAHRSVAPSEAEPTSEQ